MIGCQERSCETAWQQKYVRVVQDICMVGVKDGGKIVSKIW